MEHRDPVSPPPNSQQHSQYGWRRTLVGDYDWAFLCLPRLPFRGHRKAPPFFSKDEKISLLLASVMGLQHALAMVGGVVTTPLIISTAAGFSENTKGYLVSAALIVTAAASFLQIVQVNIPFTNYVIGSGLLSVMGISFAYLPVAQQVISTLRSCSCGGSSCIVNESCNACSSPLEGHCLSGDEAYGAILGTVMVICWFQTALSFCPPRFIRRIFPPVVTGTCLILVGVSLVGVGFELWGGGQNCSIQVLTTKVSCTGNGEVMLSFGNKHYLGLGFIVFVSFILVELFGSPFMRNIQVIIALAVAMIIASVTHFTDCQPNCTIPSCKNICYYVLPQGVSYNNASNTISGSPLSFYLNSTICTQQCATVSCNGSTCQSLRYVTGNQISAANWVTFLWTHTFPLRFYAPAALPLLFSSIVTATECIGDVTATVEASGLKPYGPNYEKSIQGALLADGLNAFWAALGTSMPLTAYAQNNGIITLSCCASRRAGYACCLWLLIFGVFAKFSAVFITVPNCILGGVISCLVASVVVSGIHILNMREGLTRRNRFIATLALCIGLGVNLVPAWVNITGQASYPNQGNFWPVNPNWSAGYRGFRDALIIFISNGFSIGGFTAMFLNLILPFEKNEENNFQGMQLHS